MNELEEMMNNVMQQANAAAAVERDPRTKKDLLDAVASLEGLLAQIRPNLLSATRRPADRKSQALLTQAARGLATSINHIADALKAEAVVEAQVQQATISRLSAAAKRKDPRDLAEATKGAYNTTQRDTLAVLLNHHAAAPLLQQWRPITRSLRSKPVRRRAAAAIPPASDKSWTR
jgi:hypothetical protein